jgi:sugar-specific transcriptional regulator TrmB
MSIKQDFENLLDKLQVEAKEEFDEAEKQWGQLKIKASEIADESVETSEEYINKAKIVGEELKRAYKRIATRLSD